MCVAGPRLWIRRSVAKTLPPPPPPPPPHSQSPFPLPPLVRNPNTTGLARTLAPSPCGTRLPATLAAPAAAGSSVSRVPQAAAAFCAPTRPCRTARPWPASCTRQVDRRRACTVCRSPPDPARPITPCETGCWSMRVNCSGARVAREPSFGRGCRGAGLVVGAPLRGRLGEDRSGDGLE